ncbi:dihydrofolate reductase [Donghicola tyrosinivorans]|uniref:Dihydrofolate reductase n=1 Tax=Donghicola tyrosinivorans TaxID=1652492 RepID=A0A2T0X4W4_9RHOB|nr:dihydrofolate reductase [Donghicola tyrosinivorans]PRY93966.1 dihydrofolate reductase [Donghicola tyrosinivorans]
MISLIVARDRNGAIGKDNTIPWHAPEDLKFFQRETSGAAVIMGRNTWESLPFKPLKNRLNIVVSTRGAEAEHVVSSLEAAIELAEQHGHRRIYGMGGARIYKEMLPLADRLLITEVETEVEGADTWFPEVSDAEWRELGRTVLRAEDPVCTVRELLRR